MATIVWSSRGSRGLDFIGMLACVEKCAPRREKGAAKWGAWWEIMRGSRSARWETAGVLARNGSVGISLRLAGVTTISLGFGCDADSWTPKIRSAVGARIWGSPLSASHCKQTQIDSFGGLKCSLTLEVTLLNRWIRLIVPNLILIHMKEIISVYSQANLKANLPYYLRVPQNLSQMRRCDCQNCEKTSYYLSKLMGWFERKIILRSRLFVTALKIGITSLFVLYNVFSQNT
jgi:hypothetical protein